MTPDATDVPADLTGRVRNRGEGAGAIVSQQSTRAMPDRIWTVPNALSLARLLGVPVFFWLVLSKADWWALGLLILAGLSDWLDGRLARVFDQFSRLGAVLDPAADRLYI